MAAAPIVAAVIGAAATTYAASEAAKAKPNLPVQPEVPKLPDQPSLLASQQQSEQQARTAGGTIFSDNKRQIGDGANAVRKTLLGV